MKCVAVLVSLGIFAHLSMAFPAAVDQSQVILTGEVIPITGSNIATITGGANGKISGSSTVVGSYLKPVVAQDKGPVGVLANLVNTILSLIGLGNNYAAQHNIKPEDFAVVLVPNSDVRVPAVGTKIISNAL